MLSNLGTFQLRLYMYLKVLTVDVHVFVVDLDCLLLPIDFFAEKNTCNILKIGLKPSMLSTINKVVIIINYYYLA